LCKGTLRAAAALSLVAPALAGGTMASSGDRGGFPPLGAFLAAVRTARYEDYAGIGVTDAAAFAEMRAHLLSMYQGVEPERVRHGFADANGSIFDCIPVEQQPGLQGGPRPLPAAPRPPLPGDAAGAGDRRGEGASASGRDQPGPTTAACPPGTIPLQRITLEDLTRFANLRDRFRK
jgi:hypothetical protein